jgi:hypothetical protein
VLISDAVRNFYRKPAGREPHPDESDDDWVAKIVRYVKGTHDANTLQDTGFAHSDMMRLIVYPCIEPHRKAPYPVGPTFEVFGDGTVKAADRDITTFGRKTTILWHNLRAKGQDTGTLVLHDDFVAEVEAAVAADSFEVAEAKTGWLG